MLRTKLINPVKSNYLIFIFTVNETEQNEDVFSPFPSASWIKTICRETCEHAVEACTDYHFYMDSLIVVFIPQRQSQALVSILMLPVNFLQSWTILLLKKNLSLIVPQTAVRFKLGVLLNMDVKWDILWMDSPYQNVDIQETGQLNQNAS